MDFFLSNIDVYLTAILDTLFMVVVSIVVAGVLGLALGMAFDREGHRLGRGRGYYDRFLAQHPQVHTIGLCFDFQLVPEVPCEPHDRVIDEILSYGGRQECRLS